MSGITGGFHEFRQLLIGLNQRFQYLMPRQLSRAANGIRIHPL